mmetsp:Transcript_12336/g.31556  ORF Transcript_12336/g.31556 Transcript_12336/m.31556 type:complete len:222 (+) Transcript_12336:722-1387(+)
MGRRPPLCLLGLQCPVHRVVLVLIVIFVLLPPLLVGAILTIARLRRLEAVSAHIGIAPDLADALAGVWRLEVVHIIAPDAHNLPDGKDAVQEAEHGSNLDIQFEAHDNQHAVIDTQHGKEDDDIGQQLLGAHAQALLVIMHLLDQQEDPPGEPQSKPDVEHIAADGISHRHVTLPLLGHHDGAERVGDAGAGRQNGHPHDGQRDVQHATNDHAPLHHVPGD